MTSCEEQTAQFTSLIHWILLVVIVVFAGLFIFLLINDQHGEKRECNKWKVLLILFLNVLFFSVFSILVKTIMQGSNSILGLLGEHDSLQSIWQSTEEDLPGKILLTFVYVETVINFFPAIPIRITEIPWVHTVVILAVMIVLGVIYYYSMHALWGDLYAQEEADYQELLRVDKKNKEKKKNPSIEEETSVTSDASGKIYVTKKYKDVTKYETYVPAVVYETVALVLLAIFIPCITLAVVFLECLFRFVINWIRLK